MVGRFWPDNQVTGSLPFISTTEVKNYKQKTINHKLFP